MHELHHFVFYHLLQLVQQGLFQGIDVAVFGC
jgi:hypothetical protein